MLNEATLFKLNKYIRLHLAKRFDVMEDIANNKKSKPKGMDLAGAAFDLPSPQTSSVTMLGKPMADVLVERMKRSMIKGSSSSSSALMKTLYGELPPIKLNIELLRKGPDFVTIKAGVYKVFFF